MQSSDTNGAQLLMKDKAQLDSQLHHAQQLGVSTTALQPVLRQEQQLTRSHAPFSPFSKQPILAYYQNIDAQYRVLQHQVAASIASTMQQAQTDAQQAMQDFQAALSRGNTQGFDINPHFARLFSQDQLLLSSASTITEYEQVSTYAREAIQSIALMQVTFNYLQDFQSTITRLQKARLDVTAMQAEYSNDMQLFQAATTSSDFQSLNGQLNAQYQQTVVNAVQTFPYVGATKLNELQTQIQLLHTYGIDATGYQGRLNADQVALTEAKTVNDDLAFIQQVDSDIAAMQDDLLRGEAHYLLKQYHQEVNNWAKAHPYYDSYDGHSYILNNGYTTTGIAAGLDSDLASADNAIDYQIVIAEVNNALFNLHQFERDYADQTPYNRVHASDKEMLTHYKLQGRQVLLVSLAEQAMRVYQNGKLVNAYHVTTGRQELPSLPGVWSVLDRKSPIIFKAAEPKGSPYWFPDTPINYAILYHWGGYFVHDAPWRADFGPGTQFPHRDSSGTTAYNFDGSHGCINLSETDATWVYKHTDWNTVIAIY